MRLKPLLIELPEPVWRWLAREGSKRNLAPGELVALIMCEGWRRFSGRKKSPRASHEGRGR